jgi:hypothetical protein
MSVRHRSEITAVGAAITWRGTALELVEAVADQRIRRLITIWPTRRTITFSVDILCSAKPRRE